MLAWFLNLFRVADPHIDLARVQWAEREERRASLDRELSGPDSQECIARVRKRMAEGSSTWIPPMFGREEAYRAWRRKHRRRLRNVSNIDERREA